MTSGLANLVTHTLTVCLVVGSALTLALTGHISGGEALTVTLAAGGVGVVGSLGVSVGPKSPPPPGG